MDLEFEKEQNNPENVFVHTQMDVSPKRAQQLEQNSMMQKSMSSTQLIPNEKSASAFVAQITENFRN